MLPQASLAVYVLVLDLLHPVPTSSPSADVMLGVPHASLAVAVPAPGIEVGLHPRSLPVGQEVNTGPLTSAVHVKVWPIVAVLPQPSVAV